MYPIEGAVIQFKIEWLYSDFKAGATPGPEDYPVHFVFLIRFPDIEPGEDHVAHFCFNADSADFAAAHGINGLSHRGYIIRSTLHYADIVRDVEAAVTNAMASVGDDLSRRGAIAALDAQYIYTDANFADEFRGDLLAPAAIVALIHAAFDGVTRGDGTTLHEALMMDDYASVEAQRDARKFDQETRWQDVPASDICNSPSYMGFLDSAGFRYYLPANMVWSLTPDNGDQWGVPFFTFLRLFPTVAPRDVGRGLGANCSVDGFIREHSFSRTQVEAIYRFLCLMAIEGGCDVDEDKFPTMCQWRSAATR